MKKFPLDPLIELRAHAVDERSQSLRERAVQVAQARQARAIAERSEREHEVARRDVEASEQVRLSEGGATAQDLHLMAHYRIGAEVTAATLRQHGVAMQQRLQRAERGQVEAEQALADAKAEQRVVENEQTRFLAAQRARAEAVAEEEAHEAWGSRRG